MEFEELIRRRSSCREFTPEHIPIEIVLEIIAAGREAPTSCNLQNYSIVVVQDVALLAKLGSLNRKFSYSPTMVLVLVQRGFSEKRSASSVSVGFVVDHIVLEATNRGLATLVMAGFDSDRQIRRILNIPRGYSLKVLLALGRAASENVKPPRVPLERLVGVNRFNPAGKLQKGKNPKTWSQDEVLDYRSRIAPVYAERFRLHSFPERCYQAFADFACEKFLDSEIGSEFADLNSFDGRWLYELSRRNRSNQLERISIIEPVDFLAEHICSQLGLRRFEISDSQELGPSFSILTYVFGLGFSPDIASDLEIGKSLLKPSGKFLIALCNENFAKRFFRAARDKIRPLVYGRVGNVYEGNTFYKAGPHRNVGVREVRRNLKLLNFTDITVHKPMRSKFFKWSPLIVVEAVR